MGAKNKVRATCAFPIAETQLYAPATAANIDRKTYSFAVFPT